MQVLSGFISDFEATKAQCDRMGYAAKPAKERESVVEPQPADPPKVQAKDLFQQFQQSRNGDANAIIAELSHRMKKKKKKPSE